MNFIQDRTIPKNIDAERAYLSAIIVDPNSRHKAPISVEQLYDLTHRKIYQVMLDLDQIDLVILKEKLEGVTTAVYLAELSNYVSTASNIQKYAQSIRESYTRRKLLEGLEKAIDGVYGGGLEETVQNLKKLALEADSGGRYTVIENPHLAEEWYEKYDEVIQTIKTGITTVDDSVGGYTKTDFGLILADTNVGKTTLLVNMALNMAASGTKVLFFSLEMTATQLTDKFISILGGHDAKEVRDRIKDKKDYFATKEKFKALPISVVHKSAVTSNEVTAEAYNRKLRGEVDIIMVDYVQRLTDKTKESETIRMKNIAQNLKNFSLENEVPIITPAQVDKASSKTGLIKVENVAWAKALADEADLALYLYEKEKPNVQSEMPEALREPGYKIEKELRCRVVKSRHSEKGQDFLVDFSHKTLLMKDGADVIQQIKQSFDI